MSQSYSKSFKYCATCAYWTGVRTTDSFSQRAIVASYSEKGKCAIPKGGWRGSQRQANAACQAWEKWPILR